MFGIYIPKRRVASEAVLKELGAGWTLDPSVTPMFTDVIEGGPDEGGGTLVYFDAGGRVSPNHLASIDLEAQKWLPAAPDGELAAGRYWLGVWKQQQPTPDDLQRSVLHDGPLHRLRDGNPWVIAIAEYLPQLMTVNRETGAEELKPLPEHLSFIEKTNELFRLMVSDQFHAELERTFRVVIPQGLRYASEALAVNYRVNRDLVDMLGVVGQFEAVQIAGIATGLDLVRTAEVAQKKTPLRALKNFGC